MTEQEINTTIAELCGIKWREAVDVYWDSRKGVGYSELPDYCNVEQHLLEAETTLLKSSKPWSSRSLDHEEVRYLNELRKIVGAETREEQVLTDIPKPEGGFVTLSTFVYTSWAEELKMVRATLRQRAEALIKAIEVSPVV